MTTFDPDRIVRLASCLESGTTQEKLDLISNIDPQDPIVVGILMRALSDEEASVRLSALTKMEQAAVRPPSPAMDQLLADPDPEVRAVAARLEQQPDALNPLEKLIPLIETMASSLGPLGGLLKGMIETMRDLGSESERTQLVTLSRLSSDNPASIVAISQALRSPHISVRLSALRKAAELDGITVPEELVRDFFADPSPEIREAADALVRSGKVGPFKAEEFRTQAMQSMMKSLMGGLALEGGDLSSLFGADFDSTALFGKGEAHVTDPGPRPASVERYVKHHEADGNIYAVCDVKVRDRLLAMLTSLSDDELKPDFEQLRFAGEPPRWAIRPVIEEAPSPRWPELLAHCGLELPVQAVTSAEQARMVSEQIWGAAYCDLTLDTPLTLVFHDGVLSRAEWGGPEPGAWSTHEDPVSPSAGGPLALLKGFLADPTDDHLVELPGSGDPLLRLG